MKNKALEKLIKYNSFQSDIFEGKIPKKKIRRRPTTSFFHSIISLLSEKAAVDRKTWLQRKGIASIEWKKHTNWEYNILYKNTSLVHKIHNEI